MNNLNKLDHYQLKKLYRILEKKESKLSQFQSFLNASLEEAKINMLSIKSKLNKTKKMRDQYKSEINDYDSEGQTRLLKSVMIGNSDHVKTLLGMGADVNKGEDTPLVAASFLGYEQIVKLLIDKGADVNKGEESPIFKASWKGHKEIVKLLIDAGADVNKGGDDGRTPLHLAAREGKKDIVRILINKGAVIDKPDVLSSSTALHRATKEGEKEIVRILIDKGANIYKTDEKGMTPLDLAVSSGHSQIAGMLRAFGA